MTTLVYAAPSTPPTPPAPVWTGVKSHWTGWDGSVWQLSARGSGVRLKPGVRGLGMPPFARYTVSSASLQGSQFRGSRASERDVFWPLTVHAGEGSAEWIEYDRAFWRTMDPKRPGVWTVTHPGGVTRSLTCRYVGGGDESSELNPTERGWANYGVYLIVEDPFWRGATQLRTWAASPPVDFFGGTGGPPFFISSSSTLGSASITNPGDEDAFPVWVLSGPITEATVGVGDRVVDVPFAVADGQALVIDTRPTVQTATLITAPPVGLDAADLEAFIADQSGTSKTRDLGATTAFAPVPPGESVPVHIAVTGQGTAQMLLESLYWRAW